MKAIRYVLLTICLPFVALGCAQGVAVVGEFPPAYPKAAELRNIVVYPFSGRDGEAFADALTAELQNAAVNGKTHFTVATPQSLNIRGWMNDAAGAARYGRKIGVQAVYFGSILNANVDRSQHQEQRQQCVKSKGFFKCEAWQQYVVTCFHFAAQYAVAPKAVDVATGSLVYSTTVTASSAYDYCSDQTPQMTPDQLIATARENAALQIRRHVAPYNAAFTVDLKKSAPELNEQDKPIFDGAVKFAEAGRMDRACAMWQELAPSDKTTSISVIYDLGVCAEVVADYGRAVTLYTKADSMLITPDKQISDAIERSRRLKSGQRLIN